ALNLHHPPNTITATLTSFHYAPAATTHTHTLSLHDALPISAADFGFTDPNDSPANSLLAVTITTLPLNGSLTLSGVAVTAGQSMMGGDLANLLVTSGASAKGAGCASFTFQVQDNGGTANAGG